ncbi:hypothetical protein U9M48_002906 [Paspalum notatum var. saurae]|uniref:Polysaccharide biosynthesis domain-containing protein n=1 Tax=Paspalum notatum var. saurae TaxID=547442 RepID=A0AAQ3SGH2_PASNO
MVPQQSRDEISLSLAVLRRRAPLRLLVFGLGHDSRLWHALNPGGATVFLEEDPAWYRVAARPVAVPPRPPRRLPHAPRPGGPPPRRRSPLLRPAPSLFRPTAIAGGVEPPRRRRCDNPALRVRGNPRRRPLALHNLPPEVYETEWDMVMIDAPKAYFAAAPGRARRDLRARGGHGARAPRRGGHFRRLPSRRQPEGREGVRRGWFLCE